MPIRLSLAEAALIASVLDEAETRRVAKHARKVIQNARLASDEDEYVERHHIEVGYCPLLGPDSACSRYDPHPLPRPRHLQRHERGVLRSGNLGSHVPRRAPQLPRSGAPHP